MKTKAKSNKMTIRSFRSCGVMVHEPTTVARDPTTAEEVSAAVFHDCCIIEWPDNAFAAAPVDYVNDSARLKRLADTPSYDLKRSLTRIGEGDDLPNRRWRWQRKSKGWQQQRLYPHDARRPHDGWRRDSDEE
jgi:hypothetical protein